VTNPTCSCDFLYGPTQDNDGTWRIKTNEELETLIKKEIIVRFIKSQR
jgi:hypothetical protein